MSPVLKSVLFTCKGLIANAKTFPGNSCDGHMLHEQLEQTEYCRKIWCNAEAGGCGSQVPGVDAGNPNVEIIHRGKYESLTKQRRRWFKRHRAVELGRSDI